MEKHVFVACDRELGQLNGYLDLALEARGQICFLVGEAGSGKTALLGEFARRAQRQHADLVVAAGQSDAQTGAGDAYLPFRELLGQLTGDVEAKLAQGAITETNASRLRKLLGLTSQALVELGPDLIGVFVPGAGLATRAAVYLAEKVGWLDRLEKLSQKEQRPGVPGAPGIDQGQVFEQYTNVLLRLAEKQPLVLVLDDLQWTDQASADLLFRLGRRIDGSRILLVGAYRPAEVALGRGGQRHPLDKVLAEFKRYYGDIAIDLGRGEEAEQRRFVDAFIDTEPNRLGPGFRQALVHHTGGHALFTIELLRAMQERGSLVRDGEGRWIEGPSLDWSSLPARVEGVIEERIRRLAEEMQDILRIASVEGEEFTAEVVAGVKRAEARDMVCHLSGEIEKHHRLVRGQGLRRLGAQRLSQYRFQHNLFRTYLYNDLDEMRRSYLHEDVGNLLEALYGDRAREISVQLAWHFSEAGVDDKAARYLAEAGRQAAARYANAEAIDYFSRALALTPGDCAAERYKLVAARERVYEVQGAREQQAQDLADLHACARELGDEVRQAEVALRQALYAEQTADYPAAIEALQRVVTLVEAKQEPRLVAPAYHHWGAVLSEQGAYDEARARLERGLELARQANLQEVEADCLNTLGRMESVRRDLRMSQSHIEQAVAIYRQLDDQWGINRGVNSLAIAAAQQGRWDEAAHRFEQALEGFRQIGERRGEGMALSNLGNICYYLNDYGRARDHFRRALQIHREVDDRRGECMAMSNLGAACVRLGDHAEARASLGASLAISREIGQRYAEGQGLLQLSALALQVGDLEQACEQSQLAQEVAGQVGDVVTQSMALLNLGHAQAAQARRALATDAYQRARELLKDADEPALSAEAQTGLAELALAEGDLSQALALVEGLLPALETEALTRAEEPFRVYLTSHRVLQATGDPRARQPLAAGYRILQERAACIGDEKARRTYLEAVPVHREIVGAWAADDA